MRTWIQYPGLLLLRAVAIMTGILAVLREALSIFAPELAPARSLFWNCVIIAFIVSASILWYQEHKKAKKREPILRAKFNVVSSAPTGDHNTDSLVLITGAIFNTGAPSIVDGLGLELTIKDKVFIGERPLLPTDRITFHSDDGAAFVFKTEDSLPKRCLSQPIPTGGCAGGGALFLFRKVQNGEISGPGTIVTLTFKDVVDKEYRFTINAPTVGRPFPDVTKLQKPEDHKSSAIPQT